MDRVEFDGVRRARLEQVQEALRVDARRGMAEGGEGAEGRARGAQAGVGRDAAEGASGEFGGGEPEVGRRFGPGRREDDADLTGVDESIDHGGHDGGGAFVTLLDTSHVGLSWSDRVAELLVSWALDPASVDSGELSP